MTQNREHAQIRAPYEQAKAVAREREATIQAAVYDEALGQTLATVEAIWEAESAMRTAADVACRSGRLKRRAAYRTLDEVKCNVATLLSEAAARWGSAPMPGIDRKRWAEQAAERTAREHPAVVQARNAASAATEELARVDESQLYERTTATTRLLGNALARNVLQRVSILQKRIDHVAQVIGHVDAMPAAEATTYLRAKNSTATRPNTALGATPIGPSGRKIGPASELGASGTATSSSRPEPDWGPAL